MMKAAKIARKLQHEKKILLDMITLYCLKVHHTQDLCDECRTLAEYAIRRTELCHYMAEKSFCSQCKTHCYKPEMRERIREVMRYAGPRIMFYHPLAALRHLYYRQLEKLNSK